MADTNGILTWNCFKIVGNVKHDKSLRTFRDRYASVALLTMLEMAAHVEYFRYRFSQNNQINTHYIPLRSSGVSVFFYEDITRIVADNTDVRARAQIAVQPAWAAGNSCYRPL